ncbi:DNA phosphorothioation-associated putative methyltransferase, partial [Phormidium pseudopriestleyi]
MWYEKGGSRSLLSYTSNIMDKSSLPLPQTKRDRLASVHRHLPRPLRLAGEAGILTCETTFLDYGGDANHNPADVVYLADILNVIQSPEESQDVLRDAWKLTQKVLIVAAAVTISEVNKGKIAYGKDGVIPMNSVHSYSEQLELKTELEHTLSVEATPAGLGVYFIFRNPADAQIYHFKTGRSRSVIPPLNPDATTLIEQEEILTPLMEFVADWGRLPTVKELSTGQKIVTVFGSLEQAFNQIVQATPIQIWEQIQEKCRQDGLIYLASLIQQKKRVPILSELSPQIASHFRALFGNWTTAKQLAQNLLSQLESPDAIAIACQNSPLGKKLPGALYVHVWALESLDPILRLYEAVTRHHFGQFDGATLIKFNLEKPIISYLFYPEFDTDPHPALQASLRVHLPEGRIRYRDYRQADNPPVLHRKETFVTPDYPLYELFSILTQEEEKLGLLNKSRGIGTRNGWLDCLTDAGVEIQGHTVIVTSEYKTTNKPLKTTPKIERHRAAIVRNAISRPMRLGLEAGFFTEGTTFFDYGCGHGGDIKRIAEQGFPSSGWDPYYSPDTPATPADVVNLGYIINVIEDLEERRQALIKSWELTQKVLIVASLVLVDDRNCGQVAYGDGVITLRHTFQKYYEQEELKQYIESVLQVEAVPVALGIYFVFRDQQLAQLIQSYRFRSRTTVPKLLKSFDEYREILTPLIEFASDRGRLPVPGELPQEPQILAEFGNLRRAFKVIMEFTHPEEWEAITEKRRKDLLTYIAVTNLLKRVQLSHLPLEIQNDIKALFPSYRTACIMADQLVFSLNNIKLVASSCKNSSVGLLKPNSFTVHVSALETLDPLLRIYEGVVSRAIGRMDEATLIKFSLKKPKISYLFYPNFDQEAHPLLHTRMDIDLIDLRVIYRDYDKDDNPPILHRKDACVTPEYPDYEKMVKLTHHEETRGLLDKP